MLDWILLIVRWAAGLLLVLAMAGGLIRATPERRFHWTTLSVALLLAGTALWLFTLQKFWLWGLLIAFLPWLFLKAPGRMLPPHEADNLPDGPEFTPDAKYRRAMEIKRRIPFTDEEMKLRQKYNGDIQFGLAVFEGERGRIFNESELPEAVRYIKRISLEANRENAEAMRRHEEEAAAEAAAEAALEKEMSTPPAAPRQCRLSLTKECVVIGADSATLTLPVQPVDLHISLTMEEGADKEGEPLLQATVWTKETNKITRRLNLCEIVDLTAHDSAEWWRMAPAAQREAFLEGMLLRAADCYQQTKRYAGPVIGGQHYKFQCYSTNYKAALSLPAGSGTILCRVHSVYRFDPDWDHEVPEIAPFFFPLNMERFLSLRHIEDGDDSSFDSDDEEDEGEGEGE
jgi:hypothetical protein